MHLIEGVHRDDEHADALLAEAFESHAVAALAHAYLTGFVLQVWAGERRESVTATIARARVLLNS